MNIEIKAICHSPERIQSILQELDADYKGLDHQIDTYYKVPDGRLKLRHGNIERTLIHYQRVEQKGLKKSIVELFHVEKDIETLKSILDKSIPHLVTIDKLRHIFFIENVKFHVDEVKQLGAFVEIEAIDRDGSIGEAKLREQCTHYMSVLGLKREDLIDKSYSDMLLKKPA